MGRPHLKEGGSEPAEGCTLNREEWDNAKPSESAEVEPGCFVGGEFEAWARV